MNHGMIPRFSLSSRPAMSRTAWTACLFQLSPPLFSPGLAPIRTTPITTIQPSPDGQVLQHTHHLPFQVFHSPSPIRSTAAARFAYSYPTASHRPLEPAPPTAPSSSPVRSPHRSFVDIIQSNQIKFPSQYYALEPHCPHCVTVTVTRDVPICTRAVVHKKAVPRLRLYIRIRQDHDLGMRSRCA
ncbi:hypothetical protein EX30DRAFT_129807 [Ascodesmis nigricans]|uniref:Uncharacterized protein n=1 Tax=Ascodesmis nigricans TaxID=341454 RepID=A0A4S2MNW2_9PEZI|nr:hypothetical protein EX30DRAFT_129807 [Ascodesmis nigricans]